MAKDNIKSTYIIFRCTKEEKEKKIKEAGGIKKLSKYIRSKLGLR